ncbi:amino acid ABC transporter permease [Yimella sp. cx-51]|uniref:amino acid ABC transporter permease n=1 Tax=Yimella sp. cx-51 TaxID=2770551 RepID=UPI00165DFA49|nr:amino acid ABC transporter permease [Yimella sp. cx-51]MBC9958073.1 amino acid ABC transporter permease [Yimella sp. cx-51]QTH38880.1 amino acid ABC transporter permease [Yimella sp. cx-51]
MIDAFRESWPLMSKGLLITLQLTVISVVLALVLGMVIAALRMSSNKIANAIAQAYLGVIRGTPLITQLFVIYYGLVSIVDVPAFWAAVAGLTAHNAAYMAEIFRSGVQSVPSGQTEAARSLGMSRRLAMSDIVAPQAFRSMLPALGNQFIIALKDTSVASFITVPELFLQAQKMAAATYEPLQFYLIAALYYLVIVLALTALLRVLERRYGKYEI